MNRSPRRLWAAVTVLAVLSTGASAYAAEADIVPAEPAAGAIAVQLNGENLTFTDAVPQVKEERTFLPFRAVFEAMGAQVSYDAGTNQVSAVRGGTTVAMTLGSTEASVTADGVTTPLTMDVAPYAADNRTYVPVRFAAQAFGCAVGWDQDDSTVILVDGQQLLEDAKAGHTYTYLDKYLAYNEPFTAGNWDIKADFDGDITVMGMGPATMEGTMSGVAAGSTQLEAAMNMKMDLKALVDGISGMMGAAAEDEADQTQSDAMLEALKTEGVQMEIRGDLDSGILYYTLSGAAMAGAGIPDGTWISMDMGALYEAMGMDYAGLIKASKDMDVSALLQNVLSTAVLTDKDTDYAVISALVNGAAQFLADDAFVQTEGGYTTSCTLEQDGVACVISFTLVMAEDDVVGYDLSMEAEGTVDGTVGMAMSLKSGMDAGNNLYVDMALDAGGVLALNLEMTGTYTAGDKAPVLTPPEGANVLPYEELLAGALA